MAGPPAPLPSVRQDEGVRALVPRTWESCASGWKVALGLPVRLLNWQGVRFCGIRSRDRVHCAMCLLLVAKGWSRVPARSKFQGHVGALGSEGRRRVPRPSPRDCKPLLWAPGHCDQCAEVLPAGWDPPCCRAAPRVEWRAPEEGRRARAGSFRGPPLGSNRRCTLCLCGLR